MTLKDLSQQKDEESLKKHTDEIELNEKHPSLIYNTLSDAIFLLAVEPDDCFRFMSVNQAFLAFTGLTREQVVGKRIEQVLPETAHALVKYKEAIVDNNTVFGGEICPYPTGELVGAVTVIPVRSAEGVCTHLVGSMHDLTEIKRAEEEIHDLQRYNRKLIEVSLDPLVTFNHEGCILDVNEATIQATGRSREELIGTPFADYFTDTDKAFTGAMMVFETGEVRDYELVMKAKDGTQTIVSYNASIYKDQTGKVVGAFAAARNITERKGAEQEIQNLQRYNRGLIETSLDPLVTFDQEGTILDVNEATIKATGRSREELIGTPFADYFTNPDKAYKGAMLTFEMGEVRNYELVMKARDGTETIVAYNASVYKDQTGKVVGAFAAARDITKRKKAEIALSESKAELDLIFQIAADGMIVIDADSNIIKVNKTFIRMVDMDEDEIIGKKCYDIFGGELCHSEECPLEVLKRGGLFVERESIKKRSDGKEIPVILNAARLERDGEFVGIVEDFKDITERKQAEETLKKSEAKIRSLNEKLEQRIKERTADLQTSKQALINIVEDLNMTTEELKNANEHLQELDLMKSMFIASTSHELRTPLNSILGFSSIMLEGWSGELTPEQKEQVNMIHTAGVQLLALINDVIDISKIEAGKLDIHITEFRLKDVLDDAISLVKNDINKKGLILELDINDITMVSNRRRLLQCVLNHLSNAVKFTENGSITLKTKTVNNSIDISITDTGIGMRSEDISKLFKPFVRIASPLTNRTSGTGLGLYLTQKLVHEALEGNIEVTSEYEKGSTFTLHIPIRIEVVK